MEVSKLTTPCRYDNGSPPLGVTRGVIVKSEPKSVRLSSFRRRRLGLVTIVDVSKKPVNKVKGQVFLSYRHIEPLSVSPPVRRAAYNKCRCAASSGELRPVFTQRRGIVI